MSFWDDFKRNFSAGSIVQKLIYVNGAAFVLYKLIQIIFTIIGADNLQLAEWLAMKPAFASLLIRPWTIITYQFLHWDFMHLLFNMLWMYWFGDMFLRNYTHRQVLSVYIWGGLWGAVFYLLSYNFIPYYQDKAVFGMLGASASVLAIVVATAMATPNQSIRLMFIGEVKLKYMAIAVVLIDLLSITTNNAGGHIAHIGGAFAGYLFAITYLNKNNDLTKWIASITDVFATYSFKRKPKMKARPTERRATDRRADMDYNKKKKQDQASVDKILEKIKQSGYQSLNKEEKEQLFKASK